MNLRPSGSARITSTRRSPQAAPRALPRDRKQAVDDAARRGRARRGLRRREGGAPPVSRAVWPGEAFPLGPVWDGHGTNFSLFSENAERVELCLFDEDGGEERIELRERAAF